MQETPHFSELVESAAKISDVVANNLRNTRLNTNGTLLAFTVSCPETPVKCIPNLKIRLFPGC